MVHILEKQNKEIDSLAHKLSNSMTKINGKLSDDEIVLTQKPLRQMKMDPSAQLLLNINEEDEVEME